MEPKCHWREDDDGTWIPSCGGDAFEFNEGGPVENKFARCPYCGWKLIVVARPEDEDGEG